MTGISSKINEMINYWRSIASAGGMPLRSDLDPSKIKHHLPTIIIAERIEHDQITIRFAGTVILDMTKLELKSRELLEFSSPDMRAFANWLYQTASDVPCAVLIERKMHLGGLFYPTSGFVLPFAGASPNRPQYMILIEFGELERSWGQEEEIVLQPISNYQFLDLGFGVPNDSELRAIPLTEELSEP